MTLIPDIIPKQSIHLVNISRPIEDAVRLSWIVDQNSTNIEESVVAYVDQVIQEVDTMLHGLGEPWYERSDFDGFSRWKDQTLPFNDLFGFAVYFGLENCVRNYLKLHKFSPEQLSSLLECSILGLENLGRSEAQVVGLLGITRLLLHQGADPNSIVLSSAEIPWLQNLEISLWSKLLVDMVGVFLSYSEIPPTQAWPADSDADWTAAVQSFGASGAYIDASIYSKLWAKSGSEDIILTLEQSPLSYLLPRCHLQEKTPEYIDWLCRWLQNHGAHNYRRCAYIRISAASVTRPKFYRIAKDQSHNFLCTWGPDTFPCQAENIEQRAFGDLISSLSEDQRIPDDEVEELSTFNKDRRRLAIQKRQSTD